MQEKLSFSARFGLTLTFEPANQDKYLDIVTHLASQAELTLDPETLKFRALQWATQHNGRSGRSARQYIDYLSAELAMASDKEAAKASSDNAKDAPAEDTPAEDAANGANDANG